MRPMRSLRDSTSRFVSLSWCFSKKVVYADTEALCKVPTDLWPSIDFACAKMIHMVGVKEKGRISDESIACHQKAGLLPQPLQLLIGTEMDDFETR